MRVLTLVAALTGVAATLLLSGQAAAVTVPASKLALTLTVDEVQTDLAGHVITSATRAATGDTVSSTIPATRPGTTDTTRAGDVSPAHATGGGCATIVPHVTASDWLLQYTYWRYYAPAHWCWPYIGANMSWYPQNPYFRDVSYGWTNPDPGHVISGYFYSWRGNGQAGHYAFRQGKITENVALFSIPIGDVLPQIEIWTTGPYWTVQKSSGT
jgi:hypothetical protein